MDFDMPSLFFAFITLVCQSKSSEIQWRESWYFKILYFSRLWNV